MSSTQDLWSLYTKLSKKQSGAKAVPTFLIRAHLSSCVLFSLAHIKGCPLALAKIAIATLPTFCSYQTIIHITAQNTRVYFRFEFQILHSKEMTTLTLIENEIEL